MPQFDRRVKPAWIKHLWPTPTGLILWIAAVAVSKFLGQQAIIATHALFEIGIVISFMASVVYSVRLSGKGSSKAPRWVFFLNLAFGLLVIAILAGVEWYSFVGGK